MGRAVVAGVLCLVVGIAAGVGIGLILGGGTAEPATGPGPAAPRSAPDAETVRETPGTPVRPRAGDAAAAPKSAPAPTPAPPQTTIPPTPSGSGTIRVVVRGPDGTPVPEIPFELMADYQRRSANPSDGTAAARLAPRPLEERMREHLEREQWNDATRQVRRSDSEGRVAFEGLGTGFHRVQPIIDGWQIMAHNHQLAWRCKAGDELVFTATRQAGVRARVTLPDGSAPDNPMICFSAGENAGYSGTGWNSATKTVWYQPGNYRVWATGGAAQEWRSDTVSLELVAGEVADVELPLRAQPGIGGVVRISPQEWPGMTWAQMYAVRVNGSDIPSFEQIQSDGIQTTTGPHTGWRYSFTGLTPGRHAVALVPSGSQEPLGTWTVDVGASFTARDFDLGPPDRSRFVEVIVLDPEGAPCKPPLQFTLETRWPSGSRSGGALTLARPNGTHWLLLPASSVPADATHTVTAQHGEFGAKGAEFKPGPNAAVEIRFEWPAYAEITVDGWDTHPDRGAFTFELRPVASVRARSPYRSSGGAPDGAGRLRCGPVAPGEYEVSVRVKSGHMTRGLADTPVTLSAGSTPVRVALPPLHSLAIDGGSGRAGRRFNVQAGTDRRRFDHIGSYTADANGAVTITRLTAGEYTIQVDGERESKTVTIPETTTLKL